MDHPSDDFFQGLGGRPSPRRVELQGPRPTPLKVRKDSHKIKKPPIAPQQQQQQQQSSSSQTSIAQPPPQRQPVIIYTISPKVIHTDPCDFMSLVQRLTGPNNSDSGGGAGGASASESGAISPAARFASIENTRNEEDYFKSRTIKPAASTTRRADDHNMESMLMEEHQVVTSSFPGILSPHPSTLPAISPNFFSSLPDPNSFNFLHDFSPINKSIFEGTFVPSPGTFFSSSPTIISPTLSFDLFNQFSDF